MAHRMLLDVCQLFLDVKTIGGKAMPGLELTLGKLATTQPAATRIFHQHGLDILFPRALAE